MAKKKTKNSLIPAKLRLNRRMSIITAVVLAFAFVATGYVVVSKSYADNSVCTGLVHANNSYVRCAVFAQKLLNSEQTIIDASSLAADGYYGPKTVDAVKRYQRVVNQVYQQRITVDGDLNGVTMKYLCYGSYISGRYNNNHEKLTAYIQSDCPNRIRNLQ